jgi:hypothetical protein
MLKILFCTIWFIIHPIHLSLLSIDYIPEKETVNVFLRIYYDDFLLDSGFKAGHENGIDKIADTLAFRDLIAGYANDKVNIIVDGRHIPVNLNRYNLSDNELSMNLSFKVNGNISTVMVRNLIMTSLYGDQANMVIIKAGSHEEGVKLTPEKTEQTFKIK